jgi:peptidoglycan/LPS O-acetylase OafA/YrhL
LSTAPAHRYPTLDLLRVVAISMTVLAHTPSLTQRLVLLRPFRDGLWMGVDLFMLISGWLLGGQLLRESGGGTVPLEARRFYFKRWMRTLPPYYALLFLFVLAGWSAPGANFKGAGVASVASHFFFLQEYLQLNRYMVSWSLCVEEHFYLLLPVLVALLGRRSRWRRLLAIVIAAELIALCGRFWTVPSTPYVPTVTHLRSHGLFLGLLFAFVAEERRDLWDRLGKHANVAGAIGLVSSLLVFASVPYLTHAGQPVYWEWIVCPTLGTWTLSLVFLPCVHERSPCSRISFPGLRYCGELTFAIYLVHDALPPSWLGAKISTGPILAVARRLVLVLGCSVLLHHLVERPFLRLRTRLLSAGGARLAVAQKAS